MKATRDYVMKKFDFFNKQMFAGRLPKVRISMSDALTTLGKCVYRVTQQPDGSLSYSDFELRISNVVDRSAEVIDDTIIHEMIHYFIAYNGLNDTSSHGDIFKSIMHSINSRYGRNISVTYTSTPEERDKAMMSKRQYVVIAVMSYVDGRCGIKVLPRVMNTIIDYYNVVTKLKEVSRVDLYLHCNPWFNSFPKSGAKRIYPVDPAVIEAELRGARKLKVEGNQVLECR